VGVDVPAPTVRPEARLPHVKRFADKVVRRLEEEGFAVVRHMVYPVSARRLIALWEHEPVALAATYQHQGPPVDEPQHSKRFLQKWQTHPDALGLPHASEGRWVVEVQRRDRDAVQILSKHMKELVKGLDLPAQKRRLVVRPGMHFVKDAAARGALSRFLVPRDPWDD
jgi:tRNA nucleotidyltransferase (CCA-adding enzyme)